MQSQPFSRWQRTRWASFASLACAVALTSSCGDDSAASRCTGDDGTLGCACLDEQAACEAPLECLSGLCVGAGQLQNEVRGTDDSSSAGDGDGDGDGSSDGDGDGDGSSDGTDGTSDGASGCESGFWGGSTYGSACFH